MRAYLAQRPVANLSSAIEVQAGRDTTTSLYTLLVPGGTPISAKSVFIADDGAQYVIEGEPAARRGLGNRVIFVAAACRLISDLQEA